MFNLDRFTSLSVSIFRVNNFYCIINCLKISHVTIYKFAFAYFTVKCLEDFGRMPGFQKNFSRSISKRLHINFNASQNVSPILLLNVLVMFTNEGSTACKCFK